MTNARFDQSLAELAETGTANARLDQAVAEIVDVGTAKARLDQSAVEISETGTPHARIDQILIEYVVTVPGAPVIPSLAFPILSALSGWSLHRRPTNSTRVAAAVSGREVRVPYYAVPLYEFEMTFDVLLSGASGGMAAANALQSLMGFFLQMQGQYGAFLFTDPDFYQVSAGVCGTGDGATTTFPLLRAVGNYSEQIQAANAVTAVYVNGVPQSGASWAVATNGNTVTFVTPPAAGVSISVDFTYYFVCRFLDDVHDYEEFMYQMHTLKSCKFRSVRTS